MENRVQILTELQEIAPVLGKTGLLPVPYAVPAGYFTEFAEMLMTRIRLESGGYAETVSGEIAEISPLLAGIRNKDTYRVPEGFFETARTRLPDSKAALSETVSGPARTVKANFEAPAKARRISMPATILRYAAAASIVALLCITTLKIVQSRELADPIMGLSGISVQDMANFLDADDVHWTPGITSPDETASLDLSDDEIHDLLRGVPDDELEQYSTSLPVLKGTVN